MEKQTNKTQPTKQTNKQKLTKYIFYALLLYQVVNIRSNFC